MKMDLNSQLIKSVAFTFFISCFFHHATFAQSTNPMGPFMGMVPTDQPQILAPGVIATTFTEYNGTFSPDGKQFFHTTQMPGNGVITYSQMKADGSWTTPVAASFKSDHSEYDPLFSPDGKRLYFSSERPVKEGDDGGQSNIWYTEKMGDQWTEPVNIPLTEDADYYSSVTNSGHIYFNVWDNGDIYKAVKNGADYSVEKLPEEINGSSSDVGDPFISPAEDYIIFRGYDGSLGRGDLYISFNIEGKWTPAENLGEPINSNTHEMCPYVTTDGKTFIFASGRLQQKFETQAGQTLDAQIEKYRSFDNGQLNVYFMKADFIDKMREKHIKK